MSALRLFGLFVVFLLMTTGLSAQSTYKYSYMPKVVYANQLFPITIIGPDTLPTFSFDKSSLSQPFFKSPLSIRNGDDTFYTFYFKANAKRVHIPKLSISWDNQRIILEEHFIARTSLKYQKDFSGVIAMDLKIKAQQVSTYDDKNNIVTLSLEAYEANMEDIGLLEAIETGIEDIKRHQAKVTAEFYVVIPREEEVLYFSYFNTIKKKYIEFSVNAVVSDASVTTQSELNPADDAFEKLKRYILIVSIVFFLLLFIVKQDYFYFILGIIALITLLTFYIPLKEICVKQGAPLYILPTNGSTVSTRISNELKTMLLGERGIYRKIEYKQGIVGWIKDEDVCEN